MRYFINLFKGIINFLRIENGKYIYKLHHFVMSRNCNIFCYLRLFKYWHLWHVYVFATILPGVKEQRDTFVNLIGGTKVSRINSVTRPKVLIDVLLDILLPRGTAPLFPWKYSVIRKYRVHVYIASTNTPRRNKSRFTERYRARIFAASSSGLIEGQRLRNYTHRIQGVPPSYRCLSWDLRGSVLSIFFLPPLLHASSSRCSQLCLPSTHQDHHIARVFVTRGRSRHWLKASA